MNILLEALADVEHLPALAGLDLLALVLHLAFGTLDLSARRSCLFVLTLLRPESSSRAKLVSSGLDQSSDRRHYFYRPFHKNREDWPTFAAGALAAAPVSVRAFVGSREATRSSRLRRPAPIPRDFIIATITSYERRKSHSKSCVCCRME